MNGRGERMRRTSQVAATVDRQARAPRRGFLQRHGGTVVTFVLLGLGAIFVLLPLFWLLSTAFKTSTAAFALPPKYITPPTVASFRQILSGQFSHYVLNSAIVAVGSTVVALVLGVPAGYAFARAPVKGAKIFNTWFVVAYVAPPVVFIIPLYIMYQHLHLLDTYQGLILAYETGLLPFTIWLMRVYFTDIPRELDEAAWIDGCSKLRALWKVVLPTVWPGLTTVGLLVGLASWGEYFGALILTGPHTETAPVAVEGYIGTTFANWNELAAAGVVLVVPALLATIVVQRGFVRGLTFGGVKQ
jgi:multiple sugar transport system permease protein